MKPQKECQSVEWKESWNDDHLKCLCAFANTSGGTLYVGIDDRGKVIRANNLHKTLEDLPNKIRNHLEIIADVSLQENKDGEYIRIDVPAYRHLVSYRGHYYYRTGSTTQELKGAALERMMLRRQRISWDSIPVPTVSIDDLSDHAFDLFRQKSVAKKREGKNILSDSKETILRNLQLITEDGHLTRAAVLLFHPHPERYVLGATVRVGFFRDESDLAYQDEFTGSLFEQVDKLEDVIFTKYLKAYISYEGFQRIERYLFPREALREGILNAVIHKDYASNNSVQIKIFEDRVIIFKAHSHQTGENCDIIKGATSINLWLHMGQGRITTVNSFDNLSFSPSQSVSKTQLVSKMSMISASTPKRGFVGAIILHLLPIMKERIFIHRLAHYQSKKDQSTNK